MCYQYGSRTLQSLHLYIQIKTAMSEDKLRILIKILVESHMAFDLGDKIDIRVHTDRETSPIFYLFLKHVT